MFVFILANLPLPLIIILNYRVTRRYLMVRRLSGHQRPRRPVRFIGGWWLNNLALIFTWTPVIVERRIFVQNHYWIISYGIAALLSIIGLILMNSGLEEEIEDLEAEKPAPSVDTHAADKI